MALLFNNYLEGITMFASSNSRTSSKRQSEAYMKHSVTPRYLAHLMINSFHFPEEFKDALQEYYILHWQPEYFKQQLVDGVVTHGGKKYLVVYSNCTPSMIKKGKCEEVKLSFREACKEYDLCAYVLVRCGSSSGNGSAVDAGMNTGTATETSNI